MAEIPLKPEWEYKIDANGNQYGKPLSDFRKGSEPISDTDRRHAIEGAIINDARERGTENELVPNPLHQREFVR